MPSGRVAMRTTRIGVLFSLYVVAGCSATVVAPPGASMADSVYAPTNQKSRPGVVKYLNQGATPVVNKRRESAYRQMHEACGGSYSILDEGPQSEGGSALPLGNGAIFAQSQYWYIRFACDGGSPSAS